MVVTRGRRSPMLEGNRRLIALFLEGFRVTRGCYRRLPLAMGEACGVYEKLGMEGLGGLGSKGGKVKVEA